MVNFYSLCVNKSKSDFIQPILNQEENLRSCAENERNEVK